MGHDQPGWCRPPAGRVEQLHPWVRMIRHRSDGDGFDEEQTARGHAGYYGCVSFVDDKIAEILSVLDELDYAGNTVVIYTSDHGETMGEHDLWGKRTLYEGSARVPLIVRWPGRLPAGTRISQPVEWVDLFPTLCDIAGTSTPDGLDGHSLIPLLLGDDSSGRGVAVSNGCRQNFRA
ncbi:MAG: sulfatase-like hydrolase/transferase [Chloroflexi bacterium]|nr:sulfatase-like hydrolase/transferase [Chloroflexota bacterium]